MSERSESNGPIDALIDSAALQMVAGEPSSSLRSAVRDRIEHRRLPWFMSPAMAGAALALVIAAVLVGRALLPDDNVRPTIERVASPAAHAPIVESDIRSVPASAEASARPRQSASREGGRLQADQNQVRLTRRLADDVAAPPQEEESLIPVIAVEPLEPAQIATGNPITVESSGVMPIEVAPLQLEPLRGIE